MKVVIIKFKLYKFVSPKIEGWKGKEKVIKLKAHGGLIHSPPASDTVEEETLSQCHRIIRLLTHTLGFEQLTNFGR